jgi:ribonuclease P/MRP protein subunit POP8
MVSIKKFARLRVLFARCFGTASTLGNFTQNLKYLREEVYKSRVFTMAEVPIDTPMTEAPTLSNRKRKISANKGLEQHALTISKPPYTYLHLRLISTSSSSAQKTILDELTAKSYLTSALTQFLGLTGSAIPIDILKTEGNDVWIRTMREDGSAVVAAVGGWVRAVAGETEGEMGWRVVGRGNWLGGLVGRERCEGVWD